MVIERMLLRRVYALDHLYGMLLTFGIAMVIEGIFTHQYGTAGRPYQVPANLAGAIDLHFMFLPKYRAWVIVASIVVCLGTLLVIEKTKLGTYLRAATENPMLVRAFGVNVPRLITITFGAGTALAGFAGMLAAPIYQISPLMGSNIIITVFAVVVVGGLGSVGGAITAGFGLGILQALANIIYPPASGIVIFVAMAIILLVRPGGLFGHVKDQFSENKLSSHFSAELGAPCRSLGFFALVVLTLIAPLAIYPVFLMKALCFALFASAFGMLLGHVGMLSLGHAAFFGGAAYITAQAAAVWQLPPELAILAGTTTSVVLGAVFGFLCVRSSGIYLGMITLALAETIYFVALQAPFTHSDEGIQGVPRGWLFGLIDLSKPLAMYYFVLAVFLAAMLLVHRIINSPFGHILNAVRDNELRAISLGYQTRRYKLLAFVLSATLSGLAGSLKALVFQMASLTDVHRLTSGYVVLMTLVGGVGTLLGPVIGAFLVVGLDSYLAPFGAWVTTIQGLVFIVCVLGFRGGIVGDLAPLVLQVLNRLYEHLQAVDVLVRSKRR
jgi:branched-chain amino acid transport system permease protein